MNTQDLLQKIKFLMQERAYTISDLHNYLKIPTKEIKYLLKKNQLSCHIHHQTKQKVINYYVKLLNNHDELKNVEKGYYSKSYFANMYEIPFSLLSDIFTILTGEPHYWRKINTKYAAIQKNKTLYNQIAKHIKSIPQLLCFSHVLNANKFIERANISLLINSDTHLLYETFKQYNDEPDTYPNGFIEQYLRVHLTRTEIKQLENKHLISSNQYRTSTSQIELKFEQFFDQLNINYERNNRSLVAGPNNERWELDFYLPEHQIAIEINPSYTHNSNKINLNKYGTRKNKKYHYLKYQSAKQQHIRLIQLFEYDLYGGNLEKYTFPKLKSILNVGTNQIDEDDIVISQCQNPKIIHQFLKENQFKTDKKGDCNFIIQQKQTNEIIGIFELNHLTKNKWELLNVIVKNNYWIINYLTSILTYIKNLNWNITTLITYTDNTWTNGDKFKKTNWKFNYETGPCLRFISPNNPIDYYTDKDIPMKILNDQQILNYIETTLQHQLDAKCGYDIIYTPGYKLWSINLKQSNV